VKLDPEKEARLYEDTWARLAAAGMPVRGFPILPAGPRLPAQPEHVADARWVGLGPSAPRSRAPGAVPIVADLDRWLALLEQGQRLTRRVALNPALLAEDALIFGLRMNAGVDVAHWRARCPEAPGGGGDPCSGRLVDDGPGDP